MADASEYRRLAQEAGDLADEERKLLPAARIAANVRARPGREEITTAALRTLLATHR